MQNNALRHCHLRPILGPSNRTIISVTLGRLFSKKKKNLKSHPHPPALSSRRRSLYARTCENCPHLFSHNLLISFSIPGIPIIPRISLKDPFLPPLVLSISHSLSPLSRSCIISGRSLQGLQKKNWIWEW